MAETLDRSQRAAQLVQEFAEARPSLERVRGRLEAELASLLPDEVMAAAVVLDETETAMALVATKNALYRIEPHDPEEPLAVTWTRWPLDPIAVILTVIDTISTVERVKPPGSDRIRHRSWTLRLVGFDEPPIRFTSTEILAQRWDRDFDLVSPFPSPVEELGRAIAALLGWKAPANDQARDRIY